MKLVRVLSKEDQSTASFSNLFTDQITIPPYSQVALINASLSLTTITVNVNSGNNTFTVRNSDGDTFADIPVNLRVGDYGIAQFLRELNRAINSVLTFTNQKNYQWKSSIAGNNVLSLSVSHAKTADYVFTEGVANNTLSSSPNIVSTSVGQARVNKSWWYSNADRAFTKGTGKLSGSIVCVGGIGLLRESNLPEDSGALTDDQIVFGVFVDGSGNHVFIRDGVRTTTSEVNSGDSVSITLTEGKIRMVAGNLDASINYSFDGDNLIPFAQILDQEPGGEALRVSNLRWTRDPYLATDNTSNQTSRATVNLTSGSRILLGFNDTVLKSEIATTSTFVGNNAIIDTTPPVSLSVELPQLGSMESYDGKTERRAQLVSVIPSLVKTNQDMSYNAPYPIFVDINNAYDLVLSSLEVRVLDSATNLPVALENPACSLTFAFKTRKE